MADTVGSGAVGKAITQQQSIDLSRSQLDEQKRSNMMSEALQSKQLNQQQNQFNQDMALENRKQSFVETQAELANFYQYRQQSNNIVGSYITSLKDLSDQQQTLMTRIKEYTIEYGKAGIDKKQVMNTPEVQGYLKQIGDLQDSYNNLVSQMDRLAPAIIGSNMDIAEIVNRQRSIWETGNMSTAEAMQAQREYIDIIAAMEQRRKAIEDDMNAKQFNLLLQQKYAISAASRAGGNMTPLVNQEAVGSRLENLAKGIKNLPGADKAFGEIGSDLPKLVKEMNPELFAKEMYGVGNEGIGVSSFITQLKQASQSGMMSGSKVKDVLEQIPKYESLLTPDSPFHQVYDFFSAINGKKGLLKNDVLEYLNKLIPYLDFESPYMQVNPAQSGNTPIHNSLQ